ncbi:MAG TPA: rhodanese-like domain-containing protein, partial [Lapillicoccus sp.]|nr:rhodanese-like domain-containing protein [Lapillicoccus sp.]
WHLSDAPGDGRRRYAQGHLPGAQFLDLEAVLTAHTGNPRDGRHPLPEVATLTAGLEALGVVATDDIVVYDESGSYAAERAWWVLRWAGLRARVLDGGIDAWTGPLETGEPAAGTPSHLDLTVGRLPTIDADEAARFAAAGGVLVDGRAPERYRGETEPLDPRAGHIPGAVNLPATSLYDEGRMPSDEELRSELSVALDGEPSEVAAYCGSGVSAARDVLALAVLGVEASLFPGSWSAWANDPARVAAIGPEPGGQTLDSRP